MSLTDDFKPQFDRIIDRLVEELGTLRTGRASPAILEHVQVEAYGTMQSVKALASMSIPDAKTLQIEPWDTSVIKAIESAIQAANIGVNPIVDGKIIRLVMPMMTEESRLKMVKTVHEKLEDAKVAIRKIREEAKKAVSTVEGGEDVVRKEQEKLDKVVKEYTAKIDEAGAKKEKEVMSI